MVFGMSKTIHAFQTKLRAGTLTPRDVPVSWRRQRTTAALSKACFAFQRVPAPAASDSCYNEAGCAQYPPWPGWTSDGSRGATKPILTALPVLKS